MYLGLIAVAYLVNLDAVEPRSIIKQEEQSQTLTLMPVPWLGVLIFKPGKNETDVVTGVILIRVRMAIVNAKYITELNMLQWKNIRKQTNVMFLSANNKEWFAKVTEASIHPDFNKNTLSTMAILHLEYNSEQFHGDMLNWPSNIKGISYMSDSIFAIGYKYRNKILEQVVYRMDYVHINNCIQFYISEKLNSQWLRPMSYHCYSVRFARDSCVFDPGLALVHHSKGTWTLFGMSTLGPGCTLPTRFLDFEYFMPWIVKHIPARRIFHFHNYWWKPDEGPSQQNMDTWILNQISNRSYTLRPSVNMTPTLEKLTNRPNSINSTLDNNITDISLRVIGLTPSSDSSGTQKKTIKQKETYWWNSNNNNKFILSKIFVT